MADFINANNQIAIPVKFNYALPTNLPSATSREVKVPSINGNNFTIINSTQILQFDLSCGQNGDYLDPTTSYIRWKCLYSHAGTASQLYSNINR